MPAAIVVITALSAYTASDQFAEVRRRADADRIDRLVKKCIKNWVAEDGQFKFQVPIPDFEEVRLLHLESIARTRKFYETHIEFFERAEYWVPDSPLMISRCKQMAEELRLRLGELDEQERRLREEAPTPPGPTPGAFIAPPPREVKK